MLNRERERGSGCKYVGGCLCFMAVYSLVTFEPFIPEIWYNRQVDDTSTISKSIKSIISK